ncbi:MAG: ketose-bisphosphate aldolase [Erysipelotrichaceae bacterium]
MLVSMKEILERASAENYAVAAPNVFTELDVRAFIQAAEELRAPLILDFGFKAADDLMMSGQMIRQLCIQSNVPIALNLDHGGDYSQIIGAINAGFTSVMVDRSSLPFEDNVAQTKYVVDIAHTVGISVEAELGHVGQAQQYDVDRNAKLTSPEQAVEFIEKTGVDCLAVAIGTAHGAYPRGFTPYLDFDRLAEIKKATNNFPLVLHGSSGTKEEDLKKVCSMGINKVNICNDILQHIVKVLHETDLEGQKAYQLWPTAQKAAKDYLKHMIKDVYGSAGKAWVPVNHGIPYKGKEMAE